MTLWRLCVASSVAITALFCGVVAAQTVAPLDGRVLFMDAKKGNCASCHRAPNDTADAARRIVATVGPSLQNIARRLDSAQLKAMIWDFSQTSPAARNTIMPPYGKHRILTEAEIDAVVAYVIQL